MLAVNEALEAGRAKHARAIPAFRFAPCQDGDMGLPREYGEGDQPAVACPACYAWTSPRALPIETLRRLELKGRSPVGGRRRTGRGVPSVKRGGGLS